jgi:hypothetical protein
MKSSDGVKIQVKADIGFLNDNPPQRFAGRLVYVCILAETSDGRKIHFARIRYGLSQYTLINTNHLQWPEAWFRTKLGVPSSPDKS